MPAPPTEASPHAANGEVDVLDIVEGLVREGRRQEARGVAHQALDGGTDRDTGLAAAAAVACAEGFDALATACLTSVGDPVLRARLRLQALTLACRQPARDADDSPGQAPPSVDAMPAEDLQACLHLALESCRHDLVERILAALTEVPQTTVGPGGSVVGPVRSLAAALTRSLGQLFPAGTPASVSGPGQGDITVLALPPFAIPGPDSGSTDAQLLAANQIAFARAVSVARTQAQERRSPWHRWRMRSTVSAAGSVAVCVADGRTLLPPQVRSGLCLVPQGQLTAGSATHWQSILAACSDVVILGLRVHDPEALTDRMVSTLRRFMPIGVEDDTSALLLREFGVEAFVTGVWAGGPPKVTARTAIWHDTPLVDVSLPAWIREAQKASGGNQSEPGDARQRWVQAASSLWNRKPPPGRPWRPNLNDGWQAWLPSIRAGRQTLSGPGEPDPIEVALAVDANLAHALPVVIESCLARASRPMRFHVLTHDLDPSTTNTWNRLFSGRAQIAIYPCDAARYGDSIRLLGHTTVSTLDRLLLPELLNNVRRVIYLDVDLVVLDDLALLWDIDLCGHALAAKPSSSPGTRWGIQMLYHALGALPLAHSRPIRRWLHASGAMAFRAFNAGVLVMDLDRMRRDNAVAVLLALVEHCAMNDQDALNTYTRGSYLPLGHEWNAAPRQDVTDGAKIVHFVGPVKPWHELYISRKCEFESVRDRVEQRKRELGLD